MTDTVTTDDGVHIAYATAGREWRPAVMFSHSLGSDHRQWEPQLDALRGEYFAVAVDTRGHGRSGVPPSPYSVARLADDMLAVADHLRLDTFHFVGLSLGGLIGQWLGVHQTHRLESLVLSNTAARIGNDEFWNERIQRVTTEGMAPMADAVLARWFGPQFATRHPQWLARCRETLTATDPSGYAACCAVLRDSDLGDVVGGIDVPTMVITGAHDLAAPADRGRWLHDQIASSELVELDCAHIGNLDAADEFSAALLQFLQER